MHPSTLGTINSAYNKLLGQLVSKQDEYRRLGEPTSSRAQARLSRLAREIQSLETRVARAERLQDAALAGRLA